MADRDLGVKLTASALGLGHLPLAPGTWASAGAGVAYLWLRSLGDPISYGLLAVLTAAVIGLGIGVCPRASKSTRATTRGTSSWTRWPVTG